MTITNRQAIVTDSTERSARIWDGSCRGLTVEHLRAFLAETDRAGIPDSERVRVKDELSTSGSWHTVELSASHKVSETREAEGSN